MPLKIQNHKCYIINKIKKILSLSLICFTLSCIKNTTKRAEGLWDVFGEGPILRVQKDVHFFFRYGALTRDQKWFYQCIHIE